MANLSNQALIDKLQLGPKVLELHGHGCSSRQIAEVLEDVGVRLHARSIRRWLQLRGKNATRRREN